VIRPQSATFHTAKRYGVFEKIDSMKLSFFVIFHLLIINVYCQVDTIVELKKVEDDFYKRTIRDSTQIDSVYSRNTISWGIVGGINYNSKFLVEIGFGKANYGVTWNHWHLWNYYFGTEIGYLENKLILAPKLSYWINGGSSAIALGLNFINYTDFTSSSLKFRPEIGFGIGKFKIVYGYNLSFFNKDFANIGNHNFNLIVYFDIKKIRTTTMTYKEVLEARKGYKLNELRKTP
jgi:hypothetical protein